MSFFIPVTSAWAAAVADRSKPRYWKLLIDDDGDGTFTDYTSYISNNHVSGIGKRTGAGREAVSNQWEVILRNADHTFAGGDLAGAPTAIEFQPDTEGYQRIFTGFVSRDGVRRAFDYGPTDKATIKLVDQFETVGARRRPDPAILVNLTICDPVNTASSIVHILADAMGFATADLDVSEINHAVDYVFINGKRAALSELQALARQYLGLLTIRWDGKLRLASRFETGWSEPASEFTFDKSNIRAVRADYERGITATRVHTEFGEYKQFAQRVIYKNTENYDTNTKKISIDIAPGAYWPGPNSGDVAQLEFKDPASGERWAAATNVQTPTIGATGSGSDIEADGGTPTLVSFNGSTGATHQNPDSAEIILKNDTGATITLTKLEIRGKPLRQQKQRKVSSIDGTVSNEWEHVDVDIPGKYAASEAQASTTTQWERDYGKVPRRVYELDVEFVPQAQEGAIVTIDHADLANGTYYLDEVKHPPAKAPLAKQYSQVRLIEKETFADEGQQDVEVIENGSSDTETGDETEDDIAERPTYTELQQGYTAGGGTKTPTAPTLFANGFFKSVLLWWTRQYNLTNWDHDELQVSSDPFQVSGDLTNASTTVSNTDTSSMSVGDEIQHQDVPDGATVASITDGTTFELSAAATATTAGATLTVVPGSAQWYSPETDGSDWKATLGGTEDLDNQAFVHANIPFTGTADEPTGRTLAYRVRRVTADATNGDWSDVALAMTSPTAKGDLEADSVTAAKVEAGFLNAIIATITQYLEVVSEGLAGVEGSWRSLVTAMKFALQYDESGTWVNRAMFGGDPTDILPDMFKGQGLSKIGADLSGLDVGDAAPAGSDRFDFDNDYLDEDDVDPWDDKINLQFTQSSKFGSHAVTANTLNGVLRDRDAAGMNLGADLSITDWPYAASLPSLPTDLLALVDENKGTSWATKTTPVTQNLFAAFCGRGTGTWIVGGNSGTILRSTDDGETWSSITNPATNTIHGICESGGTWIAVGSGGDVIRSTDDGQNWSLISTPAVSDLNSVYERDGTWIIGGTRNSGADGVILRSTDDGQTWTAIGTPSNVKIRRVFASPTAWIAVGESGSVSRSTDDGQSWSAISTPTTDTLYGVHYADDVWVAGGANGTVIRSTDDGLNWSTVTSGISDAFEDIQEADGIWIAAVVSATSGYVARSVDLGQTWATNNPVSNELWGVGEQDGTWLVVGNDGDVARTADSVDIRVRHDGAGNIELVWASANNGKLTSSAAVSAGWIYYSIHFDTSADTIELVVGDTAQGTVDVSADTALTHGFSLSLYLPSTDYRMDDLLLMPATLLTTAESIDHYNSGYGWAANDIDKDLFLIPKAGGNIWSMPVGAVYVQFPGRKEPGDLFGGTWSKISGTGTDFVGDFFRAEGGNAPGFEDEAAGVSPAGQLASQNKAHDHGGSTGGGGSHSHLSGTYAWDFIDDAYGSVDSGTKEGLSSAGNNNTQQHYTSTVGNHTHGISSEGGTEAWPLHRSIRIWERVA